MSGVEIWDTVKDVLMLAAGGGFGWLFSKLKTRRENKASDLQLIENAIAPLLRSISELTTHSGEITAKLVAEQEKSLRLLQENAALLEDKITLAGKVEKLEKKVSSLIALLKKQAKDNEKDIFDNIDV